MFSGTLSPTLLADSPSLVALLLDFNRMSGSLKFINALSLLETPLTCDSAPNKTSVKISLSSAK